MCLVCSPPQILLDCWVRCLSTFLSEKCVPIRQIKINPFHIIPPPAKQSLIAFNRHITSIIDYCVVLTRCSCCTHIRLCCLCTRVHALSLLFDPRRKDANESAVRSRTIFNDTLFRKLRHRSNSSDNTPPYHVMRCKDHHWHNYICSLNKCIPRVSNINNCDSNYR